MTYLMKRGRRAGRVAHIAKYDAHGHIVGAWCWRSGFDFSSNVPWGLRRCKNCLAALEGTDA